MYDFHIHSNHSNDSTAMMIDIVNSALTKNIKGICFTDHVDINYPSSEIDFGIDYPKYKKEIAELQYNFSKELRIFSGVEFGMQTNITDKSYEFMKDKEFDFVIGSIHAIRNKELYRGSYLEGITEHQGIINYFEDMLQCIKSFTDFNVVGHFDVIRRYLPGGDTSFSFYSYSEYIEAILKHIISVNKGIELNTSSYGSKYFHPLPEILKLYKALGGEIITLGSDSHKAETLGRSFKDALNMLEAIGFKYYTYFNKRKPEFIKL